VNPIIVDRTRSPRGSRLLLAALIVASLVCSVACSASSSSDQVPIGPKPSVSVLLRVAADAGTSVQLVATGTTQAALDVAAAEVAKAAFPGVQPGPPELASSTHDGLTVATVPVTLPNDAMSFSLDSKSMSSALQLVHPKAFGVWVCTDDRRSLTVTSTAPGAVSSDIVSGQCQVAGSTLAHDNVTWTAKVDVGATGPPSKLPVLIVAVIVLLLIIGAVVFLRMRPTGGSAAEPPAGPPMPAQPPVH
jgi:hypothetical protein